MILSTKDLVLKEWLAKKLVDQYIGLYAIDKVVAIKLQLPTSMIIYLVVNVSWVVQYRKQVGKQKIKKVKLIEVEEIKE